MFIFCFNRLVCWISISLFYLGFEFNRSFFKGSGTKLNNL